MDDDKPVDATIRPVLPSRAAIPAPEFDPLREFHEGVIKGTVDPGPSLDLPKKETPVKKRATRKLPGLAPPYNKQAKKPDARRSAAARDAWKTRRKNAKTEVSYEPGPVLIALALASKLTDEELGGFRVAVEMLQKLPANSRKLVLDALVKVFP